MSPSVAACSQTREPWRGSGRQRDMRRRIRRRVQAWNLFAVPALGIVLAACGSPVDPLDSFVAPSTTITTVTAPTSSEIPAMASITPNAGELEVIILVDADDHLPGDTMIGCRTDLGIPFSALDEVPLLVDSSLPEVEEAIKPFLESEEGSHWPQDVWLVLHRTDDRVLLVHSDGTAAESTLAFMEVEKDGSEWRWAGSSIGGGCPLEVMVPTGLNAVDWRLDPSSEPLTTASTFIHVLVTERACASGQVIGDRLLGPQVIVTDTDVLIAFAAQVQGGIQTCPGNPETAVTIELSGPIGSRVVTNGMTLDTSLEDLLRP